MNHLCRNCKLRNSCRDVDMFETKEITVAGCGGFKEMGGMRDWIEEMDNLGYIVQVACSYTNIGLISVYLTTSGTVCIEEMGYVEGCDGRDDYPTYDLYIRSWASIKRLQNYLMNWQSS